MAPEKVVWPCQDRVRLFARCELKQLCCYVNPEFSVKKSDVSEHSKSGFYYPKKKKKDMIRCCARSIHHDLGPNNFPSGPPTQSISTQYGVQLIIAHAIFRNTQLDAQCDYGSFCIFHAVGAGGYYHETHHDICKCTLAGQTKSAKMSCLPLGLCIPYFRKTKIQRKRL